MLESVVLGLLVVFVGVPLLTLLHELGHALAAAAVIDGRAVVLQGPEPRPYRLSLGRIDLLLHGFVLPQRAWVGWATWRVDAPRRRQAAALAAGPAASVACSGLCAFGGSQLAGAPRWALTALAVDAGCQAISSSLPVCYPAFSGAYAGSLSDGLGIVRLLRTLREPGGPAAGTAGPAGGSEPAPGEAERGPATVGR